jgi:hypothetical protein
VLGVYLESCRGFGEHGFVIWRKGRGLCVKIGGPRANL